MDLEPLPTWGELQERMRRFEVYEPRPLPHYKRRMISPWGWLITFFIITVSTAIFWTWFVG